MRRRRKKQASESWAATTGRVESSEVKADAEGHVKGCVLHIAYSYKAGDDWYSGFEEKRYWLTGRCRACQDSRQQRDGPIQPAQTGGIRDAGYRR